MWCSVNPFCWIFLGSSLVGPQSSHLSIQWNYLCNARPDLSQSWCRTVLINKIIKYLSLESGVHFSSGHFPLSIFLVNNFRKTSWGRDESGNPNWGLVRPCSEWAPACWLDCFKIELAGVESWYDRSYEIASEREREREGEDQIISAGLDCILPW